MNTVAVYIAAAITEIGGCFAFWTWLRLGRSPLWGIVGAVSLVLFGLVLTRSEVAFAGRAYAAYGGVYIAASLLWLYIVERVFPDRWDMIGAGICLVGAGLILWGPRSVIP
jgi:small multidrug resistance family-3 protein